MTNGITYEELIKALEEMRDEATNPPHPRYLDLPPEVPDWCWPNEYRLRGATYGLD